MKKNPKEAFGIVQDGRTIRIVHLTRDGADTYLMGMDTIVLEKDWYKEAEASAADPDSDFIPSDPMLLDMDNLDGAPGSGFDSGMGGGSDMDFNMNMGDSMGMDFSMDMGGGAGMDMDMPPPSGMPDADSEDSEDAHEPLKVNPMNIMLSKFPLGQGVISVNIHQHRIERDEVGKTKKSEIKRYRKNMLTAAQRKAGDWKSCVVETPQGMQHWLHTGPNLLLDEIMNYGKEVNTKLYFQFADANELILKNYFLYMTGEQPGLNLFIYLGVDYRKIFVFEDGKWISTLPLQVPQEEPESDVIYSKMALALDNAELGEPQGVWLAGDWASNELRDYVQDQGIAKEIQLLKYPYLGLGSSDLTFTEEDMAQYALPLAVACKALSYGRQDFCFCNFLPDKIIDGQKELRVVWHGFIVLSLIFILVTYSTMQDLSKKKSLRKIDQEMRVLNYSLSMLRAQNAAVEELSNEIAKYKAITSNVVDKLEGKNRWTELFSLLNASFSAHPESWLQNLRRSGDKISISGTTTKRANVSKIAARLPNSKINSVNVDELRGKIIYNFDIELDMPDVDWEELIAAEFVLPPAESKTTTGTRTHRYYRPKQTTEATTKKDLPQTEKITAATYRYGMLPPISTEFTPSPMNGDINNDEETQELYLKFIRAIDKGNMLEYQFLGHVMIEKYEGTRFASLIRWWVSYRLYLDGQYRAARQSLKDNLTPGDAYYAHSILMDARISFALGETNFMGKYNALLGGYARSAAGKQANIDLRIIQEELKR